MREIKFRAWHRDWMQYSDKESLRIFWDDCEYRDCPIMQYTGLKDKNGKEIYEGDICKVQDFDVEIVEIIFRNGCFEGINRNKENSLSNPYLEISGQYYEIIGNIYENKELLQEK